MATLKEIRKRLQSVENIRQITKTMEMVAAVPLRKQQAKIESLKPYMKKMTDILGNLAATHLPHPLFKQREVKKIGVVIISADRGLCGSYNANLINGADKYLKTLDPEKIELILIGRKGIEHYQRRKWKISHSIPVWGGKITPDEVQSLTNHLVELFLSEKLDEIVFIYTRFISLFNRKITIEKFLSIQTHQENQLDYILEPNPFDLLNEIIPRYLLYKVQEVLGEAYTSELAARVIAMKTATKNADEMIERLTLTRNKLRQAGITTEMLEIISGANALN